MNMGAWGVKELLIILIIVALLFGTKKLKGMGKDLGGFLKSFKNAISGDEKSDPDSGINDEKEK